MTKADIIKKISNITGFSYEDSQLFIETFFKTMQNTFMEGHNVSFREFGSFKLKKRKSKIARNINRNEAITLPPRIIISFEASKSLKEYVKNIDIIQSNRN